MVLATQIKFFFLFEGSNNCTQNLKCRLELVINDINAFLWPETKFVILLFGPYTFFFLSFPPIFSNLYYSNTVDVVLFFPILQVLFV